MIRKLRLPLAVLLGLALVSACSSLPVEQTELNKSKALWAQKNIQTYSMEFQRVCFCPPELTSLVAMQVENGVVTSRVYKETSEKVSAENENLFLSIDEVFDLLQRAVDEGADQMDMTFNETFGFPETISIDYIKEAADDELSLTIKAFVAKP